MRTAVPSALVALALGACDARHRADTPPRPAPRETIPPANLHVADYRIDARLGTDHRTIDGTLTVRWTNTTGVPATELWWHLYMNAFAGDGTYFMRTGGRGGHRGHNPGERGRIEVSSLALASGENLLVGAHYDPDVPADTTQLATPLPTPVAPGGVVEVRVAFRTVLPRSFARAGYWRDFAFAGQWFPKLAVLEPNGRWAHFAYHYQTEFYADFGRYDVALTVPEGDVVGASGLEVSPPAHSARGDVHHFVAVDVHDFAWTSWSGYRVRDASAGGIALRVLYPQGYESVAERNVAALGIAIPALAREFGPYPYPNLTVVVPPRQAEGVEGMEYPTLITTGGLAYAPPGVRDAEYAALHEFSHQYFYGVVASNENAWPFLDEGLTEFATGVAMEAVFPDDGGALANILGLRLGFWDYQGAFAAMGGRGAIARGAAVFRGYDEYGDLAYRRTAALLETVRRVRGRDATRRWLANYVARNRFRHPGPEELLATARDEFGADFTEGFLRPALFGPLDLNDRVASVSRDRVDVVSEGRPALPVDVLRTFAGGGSAVSDWDPALASRATYDRPAGEFSAAVVDPGVRILVDRSRLDNARSVRSDQSLSTLGARIAFWVAAALGALGP